MRNPDTQDIARSKHEMLERKQAEVDIWHGMLVQKARQYVAQGFSQEDAEEKAASDIRREIRSPAIVTGRPGLHPTFAPRRTARHDVLDFHDVGCRSMDLGLVQPHRLREGYSVAPREPNTMSDKYLIWSNEHRCWWNPNSSGYTRKVDLAGRYDRAEAIEIARGRGWPATGIPDEVPVLERDAVECFAPASHGKGDATNG